MYSLMIVDDESIILNGICDAVKASQLPLKAIRTAQSGEEALRKMQEEPCDILLTDIRMPDMDGLAMVARAREIWPEVRVIFLTGYQDFEYARAALRLKSDDYLLKPLADEKLFAAIDEVIKALDREGMGRFLRASGVCENSEKEESTESGNYVVRAIADYVKQHPEDDLSLGALSGKFRINPSYLSRIFPQETGQNVSEFILQVRLEAAKKLLRETDLKVYEIAEKAGFGTPGYFTKVFHKTEKISPKNYRILNGIK